MLSLFVLIYVIVSSFGKEIPKIAVIGGGVGGTSCAYFLQELFENKAHITLFEKEEIGGRLSLLDVDGYNFEAGGAVIHPRHKHMVQFSKLLGLRISEPQSSTLGVYNGEEFVFEESGWYFSSVAKLLWHYGRSMFNLFEDVKTMLNNFDRLYDLQDKGYAFTSVDHILNAMNPSFLNMSRTTLSEILLEKGYSQKFINEMVQSLMMIYYGQNSDITGLVGYISLSGFEDLWGVEGGNKLIPEGLLKSSKADFKKADVKEVALLPDETFNLKYQLTPDDPEKVENFDVVVLCVPLVKGESNIRFVNFSKDFQQFELEYHQIVSTFVKGNVNPAYFNRASVPDDILTNNDDLIFNSITKSFPIDNVKQVDKKNIYKLFSDEPLGKDTVEKMFKDVDVVKDKVWLAYPLYKPPEDFAPFILHPGLYYANAIEQAASAMEMSAISAKNIALLIFNTWKNAIDKIDSHEAAMPKDEL